MTEPKHQEPRGISRRKTLGNMTSKLPAVETEKIRNEYKSFSEEALIPGLRECFTAHHITIKIIWVALVVIGVALTVYFICGVSVEYFQEPFATKISKVRQRKYEVPSIVICLTDWFNEDILRDTNLTENGIRYLESIVHDITMSETERVEGKRDFEQYALKNNLTYYAEAFAKASWDMPDDVFASCVGCTHFEKQFSEIFKKVCYKAVIPETKAGRLSKSVFEFTFYPKSGAVNYLSIGDEIRAIDEDNSMEINAGRKYEVKIDVEKEISLNRQDAPCFDEDYVARHSYNEKICFEMCAIEYFVSQGLSCKFLSHGDKIVNSTRKLDICRDSQMLTKENDTILDKDEFISYMEKSSDLCHEQCLEPCVSLTYTSTVIDKGSTDDGNATELTFKFLFAHKGIRTLEETSTYSFKSAVSNIGGQLGLWLGFSIISVFQIILYFVNNCFKKEEQPVTSQS